MHKAKVWQSPDGRQRVVIYRHATGAYALRHERWYRSVHDGVLIAEGWSALPSDASLFGSVEIAEREARVEHPWIDATSEIGRDPDDC